MGDPGAALTARGLPTTCLRGDEMPDRTCSIDGCPKKARTRGWCAMHYRRWRMHGDPNSVLVRHGSLTERFWPKVARTADCWLWTGSVTRLGYGHIGAGGDRGRLLLAHRVAYELLVGPIPDGLELDHLCHNRACVNPDHLEPVTHLENVRRGRSGVRNTSATHCPHGHLYDEANTYVSPNRSDRQCRTCRREASRRHEAKVRKGT